MFAQLRLYLLGGVIVVFLALGGVALWYRGEAISASAAAAKAQAALSTALTVNKANQETIGRLRAQAAANDQLLAEFNEKVGQINSSMNETNSAIADLKDKDETVRSYLGAPVPDALRKLYDKKP